MTFKNSPHALVASLVALVRPVFIVSATPPIFFCNASRINVRALSVSPASMDALICSFCKSVKFPPRLGGIIGGLGKAGVHCLGNPAYLFLQRIEDQCPRVVCFTGIDGRLDLLFLQIGKIPPTPWWHHWWPW